MPCSGSGVAWIAGLGHSGTNATWRVFRALEVLTDDQSEWGPVAVLNGEILQHYFGTHATPWWSLPYHSGPLPEQFRTQMWKVPLQPVVKDPRWSFTLPYWIEHAAERIPQHVLLLDRATEDCALSWTHDHINNGSPLYEAAVHAVKHRQGVLARSEQMLEKRGHCVHRFLYPDFFLDPTRLIDTVAEITDRERHEVQAVVDEWIKPDRIHTYTYDGGKVLRAQMTSGRPARCPQGELR